jgi:biopolymer transport protein ExbB/TolQ
MENQWTEALLRFGPVAVGITGVHVVMSIIVVTIGLVKWLDLRGRARVSRVFADNFRTALLANDVRGAVSSAEAHATSQLARVLGAALRASAPFLDNPARAEYAAGVAEVAAEREQTRLSSLLRRGLGPLATIGATSTLLGLLGTVVGIMNAFTAMARAGGGSIDAIAAGIGEALLTTAIGLLVAIPAVWLYTWLNARLDRLFSELDYALQELIEWILVHGQPEVAAARTRTGPDDQTTSAPGVTSERAVRVGAQAGLAPTDPLPA